MQLLAPPAWVGNTPRSANLSVNPARPAGPSLTSVSVIPTTLTGGSPLPAAVTPTVMLESVAASVTGPFGPSTSRVTLTCWPSFALGGLTVVSARTAPYQNAVARTSSLASPGGAVR